MGYSLLTNIHELGLLNALCEAVDSTLRRLHSRLGAPRYLLFAQPINNQPLFSRPPKNITIQEIKQGDPILGQMPRSSEQLNERFAKGGCCLCLISRKDNNELLGFIWLFFEPYREQEDRCELIPPRYPPCALDVDIYIYPKARGGMVFAQLWEAARVHLHKRGIHWSMSRISAFNPYSIRAHRRLGGQCVGALQYLKLGRFELMLSSCRPYLSWSFNEQNVPRIIIPLPRSSKNNTHGRH